MNLLTNFTKTKLFMVFQNKFITKEFVYEFLKNSIINHTLSKPKTKTLNFILLTKSINKFFLSTIDILNYR